MGLLNVVVVVELGGEETLQSLGDTERRRPWLETVALREAEHARSFAKRIDELGYDPVRPKDSAPGLPGRIATAKSKRLSDRQKFEKFGLTYDREGPDIFTRFFDDMTIDIQTGELLGRYLSEERDTGRRLKARHVGLLAADGGTRRRSRRSRRGRRKRRRRRKSAPSRSVKRGTITKAARAKSA